MAHSILVAQTTVLKDTFGNLLKRRLLSKYESIGDAENVVYRDMVRKLCNIRIEEFLSSTRQKMAAEKGNASLAGQNLRDGLLKDRTNLQSRISY